MWIWILVGLLILIVLGYFIYIVLLVTFPGWMSAAIFLTLSWVAVYRVNLLQIKRRNKFATIIHPRLQGGSVIWRVDEELATTIIGQRLKEQWIIAGLVSIAAGMVTLWVVVSYTGYAAYVLGQDIATEEILWLGLVSTVTVTALFLYMWKPWLSIYHSVIDYAHGLIQTIDISMARITELKGIIEGIIVVANSLRITLRPAYLRHFEEYLENNKSIVIDNPENARSILDSIIQEAQSELDCLYECQQKSLLVNATYERCIRFAARSRRKSMVDACDRVGTELSSDKYRTLIIEQRWDEFKTETGEIQEELNDLLGILESESDTDDFDGEERIESETDLHKAFRIFGLPISASREQVKSVWSVFVKVWHPDQRSEQNDSRIKQINWAKEVLRAAGKI